MTDGWVLAALLCLIVGAFAAGVRIGWVERGIRDRNARIRRRARLTGNDEANVFGVTTKAAPPTAKPTRTPW